MQDTPQHIKDLQLKIWLSKPPMERLRQAIIDNDAFFKWVEEGKKNLQGPHAGEQPVHDRKSKPKTDPS